MAVAQIAKRVFEGCLFARCGDAPCDHTLVRLNTRRQAQQLDHMLGRTVIVVMGVVLDDEAHIFYDWS
jgi:hypothetical protein